MEKGPLSSSTLLLFLQTDTNAHTPTPFLLCTNMHIKPWWYKSAISFVIVVTIFPFYIIYLNLVIYGNITTH